MILEMLYFALKESCPCLIAKTTLPCGNNFYLGLCKKLCAEQEQFNH